VVKALSWLGIQLSSLQICCFVIGEALSPEMFGKNNGKKDENAAWAIALS
jgi:hypothetical protein